MFSKKFASFLIAGVTAAAMGATSVFAAAPAASLPLCAVENCAQSGCHWHDGTAYMGHTANDGHAYHAACGVSGCTRTGSHTHAVHGGHHGGSHHSR